MAYKKPPSAKKSPLTSKPRRNPGQSIDEEIEALIYDKAVPWVVSGVVIILMAVGEWWRWYRQAPYTPWIYTILAVIAAVAVAWKVVHLRRKVARLRLGRDGERAVGQFLDEYFGGTYKVFHDVVGDGFNIDHVLIGPSGIFTIETKTWSKPVGRSPRISLQGESVVMDGRALKRNPVAQIKAQAIWLRNLLKESTGKDFAVFPVLLFPGWYVEPIGRPDFWMLEPKALKSFIENRSFHLDESDRHLAAYHLSRYIRAI